MAEIPITIWFEANSMEAVGIQGRSELEDPLEEALAHTDIAEISGGGSGDLGSDIVIDLFDDRRFDELLSLIRRVLRANGAPPSTLIIRHEPIRTEYPL